jgi:hypothetical protein
MTPAEHKHPTPSDQSPDECGPATAKLLILVFLSAAVLVDLATRLIS